MSVITTFEPVPNRIRSVVRIVAAVGPISRDDLIDYFMPMAPKADQANNIIREAERLGLLTSVDAGLKLGEGVRRGDVECDKTFANLIERNLFSRPLDETDQNRPVAFATAWLLTRPIEPQLEWRSDLAQQMRADMEGDDIYDINSVDRAAMLAYWVRFTGYGEAISFQNKTYLVPDPTRAITRQINEMLTYDKVRTMQDFIANLGKKLPVLEDGPVRAVVEARLRRKRDRRTLSPATSLALRRLELRGYVELREKSDAETWLLQLGSDAARRVSHILRTEQRS